MAFDFPVYTHNICYTGLFRGGSDSLAPIRFYRKESIPAVPGFLANQQTEITMTRKMIPFLLIGCFISGISFAQSGDDMLAKIREEGLERSQVMYVAHMLTDRFGPRLTGSPSLERAGEWVLEHMTEMGLSNPQKEGWDFGRVGWENERLSAHVTSPIRSPLIGEVLGWTPSTNGVVSAETFYMVTPDQPTEEELNTYFASIANDVSGKIVMVGEAAVSASSFEMQERRDDVQNRAQYHPYARRGGGRPAFTRGGGPERREGALSSREVGALIDPFLMENGALVRVNPANMADGLIRAFSNRTYDMSAALPTVILRNEDYGRLARLWMDDLAITLEFEIENKVYPDGETAYNFTADYTGSEFPDEVIIIGGHLDSWHAGTGATDDASGASVMIEAIRILKALDFVPRRTIRLALWSGEEQGLLGSQAYVERHYGSFEDQKADYDKFAGYFNVDSGTGKLRGASVFGPTEAAVVLHEMMYPLNDLGMAGASSTASRRLGGSDYTSFNKAGLPGVSLGQDPIRYFTHTWHTNLDVYEQLLEDDLMQAAVVVASTIYQLSMRDGLLPRFSDDEMPALQ